MNQKKTIAVIAASVVTLTTSALAWHYWHGAPKKIASVPKIHEKNSVSSSSVAAREMRFDFGDGTIYGLEFSMSTDAQVSPAALKSDDTKKTAEVTKTAGVADDQKEKITQRGQLLLKFFKASPGVWDVAARIINIQQLNTQGSDVSNGYLTQPFVFRMTDLGYMSNFKFTKGMDFNVTGIQRQILGLLQVGLPRAASNTWSTREVDATGIYRARYILDAEGVHKQKLDYLSLQGDTKKAGDTFAAAVGRVPISDCHYTISETDWVTQASLREKTAIDINGKHWAQTTTQMNAKKISGDFSTYFPISFSDFMTLLKVDTFAMAKYYQTNSVLSSVWAKLNMQEAMQAFADLSEKQRQYAIELMINYLRLHPERSQELVQLLDRCYSDKGVCEWSTRERRMMIYALVQAGHKEAQQALVDAATNPRNNADLRTAALMHMHQIETPQKFVSEELWDRHRMLSGSNDRLDVEQRNMSLFVLGSLGDKDKLNPELSNEIATELSDYLKQSGDRSDQIIALEAMGNHGGEQLLDAIEPIFASDDVEMRATAYFAMRRMDTPEAAQTLINNYEKENVQPVKTAAMESLAQMPPSDSTMTWARNELLQPLDPSSQKALVAYLGHNLVNYPQNEQALRALLQTGPTMDVKRAVYAFISP